MNDYVVVRDTTANEWQLQAEQRTLSRHPTEGSALIAAVRLAHAAAAQGHPARILRQVGRTGWSEIASLLPAAEPLQSA
jgi:hypothetical protein